MKKIALVLVAAMVLVFTGCEKKETISMPFDVADVNNIETFISFIDLAMREGFNHSDVLIILALIRCDLMLR